MNNENNQKLKELLEKNKQHIVQLNIKNNVLLQECLDALGINASILEPQEHERIYNLFSQKVPQLTWEIDSTKFHSCVKLETYEYIYEIAKNKFFYIIWGIDLYIIKCDLPTILQNIYDVICVSPDTWLLSEDFKEVIEFFHEGHTTYAVLT